MQLHTQGMYLIQDDGRMKHFLSFQSGKKREVFNVFVVE